LGPADREKLLAAFDRVSPESRYRRFFTVTPRLPEKLLRRLLDTYPRAVWLNPVPEKYWGGTTSIGMIRQLMEERMFPLTLDGIDRGMRELTR